MEIEFEALHLAFLAFAAVVILVADHDGYLYLRCKKLLLDAKRLKHLHLCIWIALAGMILTGVALVADEPEVLAETTFLVKLLMVAALVVNGVVIGQLLKLSISTPFAQLSPKQKLALFTSGSVSVSCWIGRHCLDLHSSTSLLLYTLK